MATGSGHSGEFVEGGDVQHRHQNTHQWGVLQVFSRFGSFDRPPPWEETPVRKPTPKETGAFLQSERAEALGVRELHRLVQSLDDCFFMPEPDYRRVGVLCQRVLCAAANVVARVYPKELSGVDVSQPRVAVHVLDSFFASRLGENLDEPSRKLMRHLVVLTDDLLHLGTAGRCQATVCMESVRFLVSSLLVLL